MYIYIVIDDDDRQILEIYDEETFKKVYKRFVVNPPIYLNEDYWDNCYVVKFEINSDKSEDVSPENIK